jgi:hypothetical protein
MVIMMNDAGMSLLDATQASPITMAIYFHGPQIAVVHMPNSYWSGGDAEYTFSGTTWLYSVSREYGLVMTGLASPSTTQYHKANYTERATQMFELQQVGIKTHYGWVPIQEERS